jgi:hypothetical protein
MLTDKFFMQYNAFYLEIIRASLFSCRPLNL